jgi:thymidylate kinase
MSAVLITGCSGAGKTTIAAVLARRGLAAIDSDDDPLLARMVDSAGAVVQYPAELELADRFTHIFMLEIDEPTMLARLDARRDYHDWGRIGDTREYLRGFLPGYQDRLRAFGAIPIDARQPLDRVVDAILSHTLADAGPGQACKPGKRS